MRFERWRGMPLVVTMAAVGLGLAWATPVRADGYRLHHTIPREVVGYDYATGGEMMAPPVPYGHYAKDHVYNPAYLLGCAGCRLHGLLGCVGCGHEGGHGHGKGCGACGGRGCGLCSGHGHGGGDPGCGAAGCGGGRGHHHKAGRFAPCDSSVGPVVVMDGIAATSQSVPAGTAVVQPSGQYPCGLNGCGVVDPHSHHGLKGHSRRCGLCGGKGCGGCGGAGMLAGCGNSGCGLCHGKGKGCHFCGGKGCSHCMGGLGLHGKLAGLLHHQKVDYFVGAGGPVPITPGYVPYVVVTRSPRDFFSFPPMNPYDP
jgi:hypothetical protein